MMGASPIAYMFLTLACGFYFLGSWGTFRKQPAVLVDFGIGLAFDITTVVLMMTGALDTPGVTHGLLFTLHVILATIGLAGFIIIFGYIAVRGDRTTYPLLGKVALFAVFPIWLLGTICEVINSFM